MARRYAALGGRVLSASAYLGGGSGSMQIGIYADDADEPGILLGASETSTTAMPARRRRTMPIPGTRTTASSTT
jgi:hypothetical protein